MTRRPSQKERQQFVTFIHFIFLTYIYIFIFICVTLLSQGIRDGDPRKGSKHVGLTYNYCDL
jgi:hypothetical protein